MEIIRIKINDILPYENNAKEHPQEQIEQIKKSILEYGNNDPIAIDENNVIIAGHGRYQALKELGYTDAEVIKLEHLNEQQKAAYRLVHNQLTMNTDWDTEKLKEELKKITLDMYQFGFEEELLNEIEDEKLEIEEDDFNVDEALSEIEEPITKQGDIYLLGNHRLICGDSTNKDDIKLLLGNDKVDLLLTDPPYNINVSNSQGMKIENDNMDKQEFISFLTKALSNAYEVMKDGAVFYIWYADTSSIEFNTACRNSMLEVKQNLIWVKNQFILGRQDYHWRHEPCLTGWKEGAAHYFINDRTQSTVFDDSVDLDTIPEDELRNYVKELVDYSTIFYEKKPTVNSDHPTMKPIKLIGKQIKNSSKQNQIVLDLFGGSGTTLLASEQLNRTCYMVEYDPKYCDVIVRRWEEFTGKKAVLMNA